MAEAPAPPGDDDPPPVPLPAAVAARIRQRLLARIAGSRPGEHLTMVAGEGRWQPCGPGVWLKPLHRAGDVLSYLLRLAPGATLPAHRHPLDEECVVLAGSLTIGGLTVGAGSYHLARQGRPHAPIHSAAGALVFLRGAVPEAAHRL